MNDILFWPDLATSHYATAVRTELDSIGIEYVSKVQNPPNVPQARPIEEYWNIIKQKYEERKEPVKNFGSFKRVYRKLSREVPDEVVQKLMKKAKRNLRAIGYKGVYATF